MGCEAFIWKPSLKQMSLMKSMSLLWNSHEIRLLIQTFPFPSDKKQNFFEWKAIAKKVEEKLQELPLPKELIQAHIMYKYAIGDQIKCWWEYHHFTNHFLDSLPKEFRWTSNGTINLKETAELVVEDESIDIIARYKLSCIYCLRDKIAELRERLPERRKADFYDTTADEDEREAGGPSPDPNRTLIGFWIIWSRSSEEPASTAGFLNYFQYAVRRGNLEAARFFLGKLSQKEKDEALTKCASAWQQMSNFPAAFHGDLIFYLLLRMNPVQQTAAFEKSVYFVLLHSLKWPRQRLFRTILSYQYRMSRGHGQMLVHEITILITSHGKEYNYSQLFIDFWRRIPARFRSVILGKEFIYLASTLMRYHQEKVIRVVFAEASAELKHSLVFSHLGKKICAGLVVEERWKLAKFYLHSCLPSKELMIEFRAYLIGAEKSLLYKARIFRDNKTKWGTFFRSFDDWIREKD